MFDFEMNTNALTVCEILQNNGFQACFVGGCVRDMIMGQTPKDWDITTNALPEEVIKLFAQTYPTGIDHGTVTAAINDEMFEITTFRTEATYSDGRHPDEVTFVPSIEEDLARRDLTINAIAYDPIKKVLIDYFNGCDDIKNKIIRAVGNPFKRFSEDGLRIMRTARFASRLQFTVDEETQRCMTLAIDTLKKISAERIRDELSKILATERPSIGLELLYQTSVFDVICPIIKEERQKFDQLFLNLDSKRMSEGLSAMMETKLAYILHGATNRTDILKNLKFSKKEIERAEFLYTMYNSYVVHVPFFQAAAENFCSARMFLGNIKNWTPDTYAISLEQARAYLHMWDSASDKEIENILHHQVIGRKDMVLRGGDIMSLGISPGPMIKTVLSSTYIQILRHPEDNVKETLLEFAKEFITKFKEEAAEI